MLADFVCDKCKTLYEDKVIFDVEKEQVICPSCNYPCERLVSLDNHFRLKYNNKTDKVSWGGEGYRSSQYWKEYDKQAKHNIHVQGGSK